MGLKIERGLLDRMVSGAFMGKREIGRPIKYNIRTRGKAGWIELIFNPRTKTEKVISDVMRFMHPYIAFITYRFHVEKSRETGLRIEDFYMNKFHKEPYFMMHIYAQYFHPSTLLERVRDVRFHRNPRTIFKGFRVPDWATAESRNGWQVDAYSRQAWDNAMADFRSESTPMQFFGERQEPNPLQWLRLEQFGKGMSSRLFYNEVPHPTWIRHEGHLDNPEETLYSFTRANEDQQIDFGIDTTTEEGRAQFKAEFEAIRELAPEIIKKSDMVYPHEQGKQIPTEPHFQRVWRYYQEHALRTNIDSAVGAGKLAQGDADAAISFMGGKRQLSCSTYALTKTGSLPHLVHDEGFLATERTMLAIGMNIPFDNKTAEPFEHQFWGNVDGNFQLTELDMRENLPQFISDPSNRMVVEALMEERTQQLSA